MLCARGWATCRSTGCIASEWAWRGYNEQLAVAALLTGGGWRACFASHYVATRMADRLAASLAAELPLVAGARESSLWMERAA